VQHVPVGNGAGSADPPQPRPGRAVQLFF